MKGAAIARQIVAGLLSECRITGLDGNVLEEALALPLRDFEDAVQVASAVYSVLTPS